MTTPTSQGVVRWPEEVAAGYRANGYWSDRSLGSLLWETADSHLDEVAVVDGSVRLTYRELISRADAMALRLGTLGIRPDDRILLQMPNGWAFIVLTLACLRVGVIPVMAMPGHRRHELAHLASLSESRAIVVPDVFRDFDHQELAVQLADELAGLDIVLLLGHPREGTTALEPLLEPGEDPVADRAKVDLLEPDPDSPACFLISGGTTGLPKLITRTHNGYACNMRATAATANLTAKSVYLGTLPASHNFPLGCPGILGTLLVGGKVVMLPSPEPVRAFQTIRAEGVTIAAAVPAIAQRWIDHQLSVTSNEPTTLEVLQVGGSRLPDEFAYKVTPVLGCTLQQVFGMAEGLINTTRLDDSPEVICSTQGRPVHEADEVRVLDESGNDVPDGQPGLLYTRGPYTPRGYYNAPEQNVRSFLPEGWYGSGDIVVRRPDGNLVVQGRDKDMINRGGEKISAEDIETIVYGLEGIDLVAAVSMPDEMLGERVCIYVVPKAEYEISLTDVKDHFNDHGVATFKIPDRMEIVATLPMTKVGKIDKRALREDINERIASSASRLLGAEPQ